MKKRILLIDGEGRGGLSAALTEAGYGCAHAATVREALSMAEGVRFDLTVLDAALLDGSPSDSISLLRVRGSGPILVIAPVGAREKLIGLLDAGAEDYLTRPFALRELVERIEVQLRRSSAPRPSGALRHRELKLNPETYGVILRGQSVKLTKQEFRILELMLLFPPGRVFSKQDFFNYAWGDENFAGVDKTINVHMCNIRKKFRAITDEAYIETIWGLGFRLV